MRRLLEKLRQTKILGVFIFVLFLVITGYSGYIYSPKTDFEDRKLKDVSSKVRVLGKKRIIWSGDVRSGGCTVVDKRGVKHTINQAAAICALDAASKTGKFTYVLKDFGGSLGLFLDAIAEDSSASNSSSFWLYDVNGKTATEGVSSYVIKNGDSLFFHFENSQTYVDR